jgi:geranylgeranyl pyrophosphate synthase
MDELWRSIQSVKKDFKRDMELIERELNLSIPSSTPAILYSASKHLTTGGKRIRPILLTLSFNAVNSKKSIEYALPIAAAVELIHTATIIHDDILDKSSRRRGVETVNARWGNDVALIAGDLIFSRAFGLVATHENKRVGEAISYACRRLAEGQVLENMHTRDIKMTEEVYLEVIERKTAALFEACTKCGAILGGGSEEEIKALSRYGYLTGIGFQMTDDVLDVNAGEVKLGKPVGVDVSLGKPTFVILHALKAAKDKDKKTLENILYRRRNSLEDVKKALNIIRSTNSIEYASKRARSFIANAKKELSVLRDTNSKKALELIADYAISREF